MGIDTKGGALRYNYQEMMGSCVDLARKNNEEEEAMGS